MAGTKSDGTILLICGGFFLLGSALLYVWAWSEDWSALPTIAAVGVTICALVLGGFGISKLVG